MTNIIIWNLESYYKTGFKLDEVHTYLQSLSL